MLPFTGVFPEHLRYSSKAMHPTSVCSYLHQQPYDPKKGLWMLPGFVSGLETMILDDFLFGGGRFVENCIRGMQRKTATVSPSLGLPTGFYRRASSRTFSRVRIQFPQVYYRVEMLSPVTAVRQFSNAGMVEPFHCVCIAAISLGIFVSNLRRCFCLGPLRSTSTEALWIRH
ncbi:hypothetical protein GQ43DRAFT_57315 [Delitschia confertaspora ATCC 74209]|uniref:Uncharacterized protein n=1 Tax=Delitschia confertaspora ATCC 74209 TaxID=1513339 RepID=A0A9P4JK04_9PLEO|nr:hypothetical protein GQ43DRAFT_57315 [Delitschia confertaspora ATCC 74209]